MYLQECLPEWSDRNMIGQKRHFLKDPQKNEPGNVPQLDALEQVGKCIALCGHIQI